MTFLRRQHNQQKNIKKDGKEFIMDTKIQAIQKIIKGTSPVPWNGLNGDRCGEAFLEVHCFPFHKLPGEASSYLVHLLTLTGEFLGLFLRSSPVKLWNKNITECHINVLIYTIISKSVQLSKSI